MSWMSSDMYDCKICGHRSESSSEVHKCEFVRKSDLLKIVERMEGVKGGFNETPVELFVKGFIEATDVWYKEIKKLLEGE